MQSSPRKVLLLSLSGIGNYLMQAPTIAALKTAHPDWHVTVWVAPRGTKALAESDPNVDTVIEAPIRNSLTGHIRTVLNLRREKYDVGIILSPGQLLKSAAYLYFSGIPKRIGHTYPLRSNPHSSFLLTQGVKEDENLHDIEQNLRLLKPIKVDYPPTPTTYDLPIPQENQNEAQTLMSKLQIPGDKHLIGIHAGSAPDFTFKRWPLENFATVAKELIRKHNSHILLFGGPDEENQKQDLQKLIGTDVYIISSSLLTTAAILKRCDFVLSNDSGLMHLAAASGVKTFGLFGPTDEKKTGPRGKESHVIRALNTHPVYDTENNPTLGSEAHPTIVALTPEEVLKKTT